MNILQVYFDGACRGANGTPDTKTSAGVYSPQLGDFGQILNEGITNNNSEYTACILALEIIIESKKKHIWDEIQLFGDSNLVVNQGFGSWKCNEPTLLPYIQTVRKLAVNLPGLKVKFIKREFNREADRVANSALDNGSNLDEYYLTKLKSHGLESI